MTHPPEWIEIYSEYIQSSQKVQLLFLPLYKVYMAALCCYHMELQAFVS